MDFMGMDFVQSNIKNVTEENVKDVLEANAQYEIFKAKKEGRIAKPKIFDKPIRKEYDGMTLSADDYGPQRFCKCCGIKLEERWDTADDKNVYLHPEIECEYIKVVEEDEDGNEIIYFSSRVMDSEEMTGGRTSSEHNQEKEDTRDIPGYLLEMIDKIRKEHHDDAGKSDREKEMPTWENEDGDLEEKCYSKSVVDQLWESPVTYENTMKLTTRENAFLRYVSSMAARGPKKLLADIEETFKKGVIRREIAVDAYEITRYFLNWEHPDHRSFIKLLKLTNSYRKAKGYMSTKRSWEFLRHEERVQVLEHLGVIDTRPATVDAAIMEDWELESRKLEAHVYL